MSEFSSILKNEMTEFLEQKRTGSASNTYLHYRNVLQSLDQYLVGIKAMEKALPKPLLNGWTATILGKPNTIQGKAIQVRVFCSFLRNLGIHAEDPDLPITRNNYVAYHFTDEDLNQIYGAIDNLKDYYREFSSNRNLFIELPVIFRILLCCGMRLGETVSLKVGDVDFVSGCMHVLHDSKNGKQRLVPMHPDMTEILRRYCMAMGIMEQPSHVLFPQGNSPELAIRQKTVSHAFHTIMKRLQIGPKGRNPEGSLHERGACIHCLRHAFAFRSFRQCEDQGISVTEKIPYLSFYLGHERLDETEKYLLFSPDLQPKIVDAFEEFSSSLFPEVL